MIVNYIVLVMIYLFLNFRICSKEIIHVFSDLPNALMLAYSRTLFMSEVFKTLHSYNLA